MGDTGSLSLGGSLAAIAIIVKHEIVLAIIGGLFVLETVSVIIQVASFKLTGKRIFKWHQYIIISKKRDGQSTIVIRFWIIAIILALVGLATLKLRYSMVQIPKLREQSFLVYGLGLSGYSVIKFFKKNRIKNFKIWDDKKKNIPKKYTTKNLKKTLLEVDYIVLSPGISLIKNKQLIYFKKKIITDIDLFYLIHTNFKSIVVTGTNVNQQLVN